MIKRKWWWSKENDDDYRWSSRKHRRRGNIRCLPMIWSGPTSPWVFYYDQHQHQIIRPPDRSARQSSSFKGFLVFDRSSVLVGLHSKDTSELNIVDIIISIILIITISPVLSSAGAHQQLSGSRCFCATSRSSGWRRPWPSPCWTWTRRGTPPCRACCCFCASESIIIVTTRQFRKKQQTAFLSFSSSQGWIM